MSYLSSPQNRIRLQDDPIPVDGQTEVDSWLKSSPGS